MSMLAMKTKDRPILDVADVVALERRIAAAAEDGNGGASLHELMTRAGNALADACIAAMQPERGEDPGRGIHPPRPHRAIIFCGTGNNGGDGWVCAARLAREGWTVVLVTPSAASEIAAEPARTAALEAEAELVRYSSEPPTHAASGEMLTEGQRAAMRTGALVITDKDLDAARAYLLQTDLVVDAMLGTGFNGESVRAPFGAWIEAANAARRMGAYLISADVPSGLSAQTGRPARPCIEADETVTMIVMKRGLISEGAEAFTGALSVAELIDIEPFLD